MRCAHRPGFAGGAGRGHLASQQGATFAQIGVPLCRDSDCFLAQWATMGVTVFDNPMASRYEARIDGVLAGISEYELTPDTIIVLDAVVAEEYEGQGVGTAIARYALDDARARDLHVRPLCPFIRSWMQRHPEY